MAVMTTRTIIVVDDSETSRRFARLILERAGYEPEMHWFNGGHEIDPELKKAAFDFALNAR